MDSDHNGHNPKWPKPKRPQTETATNRNGHRPKGHKPKRPQTETATDRNGHKPKRPQTETVINRNRRNYIWFSGLQICVLNKSFKLVLRHFHRINPVPITLRKWLNTMIIGYLNHYVPCRIGDASTLWGPGLLNYEGNCRLQQICNHIYVSEMDTWHHWFRRSIRHKSWTSDASNKPQKYVLIGFYCFNWHIEIGD